MKTYQPPVEEMFQQLFYIGLSVRDRNQDLRNGETMKTGAQATQPQWSLFFEIWLHILNLIWTERNT